MRIGILDRHRNDVVLAKDLDGALCTAGTVRDEQDGVALLSRVSHVGDPIGDTATELHRRLSGDLMDPALILE